MPHVEVAPAPRRLSRWERRRRRTRLIYEELRRREKLKTERFPVTILLGAQMVLTILVPAYRGDDQSFGLLLAICAMSVAAAFYVELMLIGWRDRPERRVNISVGAAGFILGVGTFATVGAALGGQGSYAVQVGLVQQSAVVALFSPFTIWLFFGAVLFMWLYREGRIQRAHALLVLVGAVALQLLIGIERAILGPALAFGASLMVVAIFARLIRLRTLVVALLLLPVLWPPIYEYRNAVREELTGSSVESLENPLDRLNLNEQMALVTQLTPRPAGFTAPSLELLVRTGLVPRAIDPDRPTIDTGTQMSVALGGSRLSSTSATMMGNVYIFSGLLGVAAIAAATALSMKVALRRSSPWALAFAGLIYLNAMSFNASYPDVVPKMLQGIVSLLLAALVARAVSNREVRRAKAR